MNNYEWISTAIVGLLTIYAIYQAPRTALRLQKELEYNDAHKERKISIFKILMATRAQPVSFEHVRALNMIDIEFYNDKEITEAWNTYRDHLNSYPSNSTEAAGVLWRNNISEYLTNLLFSMSKSLGYNFDKILLKKGAYAPIAHGIIDDEQTIIRKSLLNLLAGNTSLKIEIRDRVN